MTRGLTTEISDLMETGPVNFTWMIEMDLITGPLWIWTGNKDVLWYGKTWKSVGGRRIRTNYFRDKTDANPDTGLPYYYLSLEPIVIRQKIQTFWDA